MTPEHICPSAEDFQRCDWQEAPLGSDKRECRAYAALYGAKAREVEAAGDTAGRRVFALLYHVCSLMLMPDSPEGPLVPRIVVDDLSDDRLRCLEDIVHMVRDAELRARIADVLCCRRVGGHQMAGVAVPAYVESAEVLEDPDEWFECAQRIRRALDLAASLGKTNQPFKDVVAHIESVLDKYQGEDPLLLSATLMEMLQDHGQGDHNKYAALAEKAALRAESEESGVNWQKARRYWSIKTRWHVMEGNEEAVRESRLLAAETYVRQADDVLEREGGGHAAAASLIQQAIEAFGRVGGTRERRAALHDKMLHHQKESAKEFKSYTHSLEISELVEEARGRVRGKTLRDALFELAICASSPRVTQLRERVEEHANKFFFLHFVSMRKLDEDGRVVGRRPGLYGDASESERALKAEMFKEAAIQQSVLAQGVVRPAIAQIKQDHDVGIADIMDLVSNSPFVPQGREYAFARGLRAGLDGDLLLVPHLLCPQVENSLRFVLAQRRVRVVGLTEDGIQDVHSLERNLRKPEARDVFGEDIVFDLRGLLVERFGANLRNLVAHGLMNDDDFYSWHVLYLWWLSLRLCVLPLYSLTHDPEDTDGDVTSSQGQVAD